MLSRSCVHGRLLRRSAWSGGRCLVSHAAFVSEHEHARIERRHYSASSFARSNQCMFGFEESGADTGTRRNVRSTPETGHRRRPAPITCPSNYGQQPRFRKFAVSGRSKAVGNRRGAAMRRRPPEAVVGQVQTAESFSTAVARSFWYSEIAPDRFTILRGTQAGARLPSPSAGPGRHHQVSIRHGSALPPTGADCGIPREAFIDTSQRWRVFLLVAATILAAQAPAQPRQ
jgi:hypothetical protein